jgi:hypothetical protein
LTTFEFLSIGLIRYDWQFGIIVIGFLQDAVAADQTSTLPSVRQEAA